jgi:protein O-mannosyl-transferase
MKQKKQPHTKHIGNKVQDHNKRSVSNLIKWIGLIVVVSFFVFFPGLTNELVSWDDYNYIKENPIIQTVSWANITHLFNYKTYIMGNYHPLTILSYMAEYSFVGENPFLYHLDNILLHLVNIVLFAWIMWLLSKKFHATIIATALFAIHPMRVESVVWAAERKDVLYTCFFLLSMASYIFYITKTNHAFKYYLLSLLFFLLSILSKGQAVVLPMVLILIDFWYNKKMDVKSIGNKIPFFAIALIFGILAILAQSSSLTEQRLVTHSFLERILFAFYNITSYLYKLILPYNLACFYGYPPPDKMGGIYLGAILAVIMLVFVFVRYRANRIIMFGTFFFLVTIFIVIQILPIGNAIIADRYTYIPYIGLFFIIGMLLELLIAKKAKLGRFIKVLIVVQLLVFGTFSFIQAETWKNNETLWKHALKINPEEGIALNNLGATYLVNKEYDKAIEYLNKAVQNRNTYSEVYRAYTNLGKAYAESERQDEAIQNYNMAVSIAPAFMDAVFDRGLSYTSMGKYDSAIADFTTIVTKIQPRHAESYYSRAIAYNKKQMPDSAIADYTKAIEIRQDYGEAYVNRGNIYFNKGDQDQAIANYIMALKFIPDDGKTYLNRSFAYFRKNDYGDALEDAQKAISLSVPVNPAYIDDLKSRIAQAH